MRTVQEAIEACIEGGNPGRAVGTTHPLELRRGGQQTSPVEGRGREAVLR